MELVLVPVALLILLLAIRYWYLALACLVLWFVIRPLIRAWLDAKADQRRHARARRDIRRIHDETVEQMRRVASRDVIDGKARRIR